MPCFEKVKQEMKVRTGNVYLVLGVTLDRHGFPEHTGCSVFIAETRERDSPQLRGRMLAATVKCEATIKQPVRNLKC
jgi:virulence-associated protein VapD